MNKLINLCYSIQSAYMLGETDHPQKVVKDLGIFSLNQISQPIADCWQFFGCALPDGIELPAYLKTFCVDSYDIFIGFGLDAEEARVLNSLN